MALLDHPSPALWRHLISSVDDDRHPTKAFIVHVGVFVCVYLVSASSKFNDWSPCNDNINNNNFSEDHRRHGCSCCENLSPHDHNNDQRI